MRADLGIEVLSLQYYQDNETDGNTEDVIDESQDAERDAIKKYDISKLRYALSMLTEEEMELVDSMYLSGECPTERQYAEKVGMLNTTVHYIKQRVLDKLRMFMAG